MIYENQFDKTKYINYKVGNMLEALFGSKNRERVLQFVLANGEGYAKEIADFYDSSVDLIQKQLENSSLEECLSLRQWGVHGFLCLVHVMPLCVN